MSERKPAIVTTKERHGFKTGEVVEVLGVQMLVGRVLSRHRFEATYFRGQTKFKVGMRVRLSSYGKEKNIRPKTRLNDRGSVVKVDQFNTPVVLWDGQKTPKGYYPGFIEPVVKRQSATRDMEASNG